MDVRIVKSVIILLVVSLSLFLQNKQKKGTEIQKVFNRSLKELKNSRMEEEGGEGLRQKEGIEGAVVGAQGRNQLEQRETKGF